MSAQRNSRSNSTANSICDGVPILSLPLQPLAPVQSYDALKKGKPVIVKYAAPSQDGGSGNAMSGTTTTAPQSKAVAATAAATRSAQQQQPQQSTNITSQDESTSSSSLLSSSPPPSASPSRTDGAGSGTNSNANNNNNNNVQRPPVVLIWLHGAGQNPDNEIFRRFANALYRIQQEEAATGTASPPAGGGDGGRGHGGVIFDVIHSTTHQLGEATVAHYLNHNSSSSASGWKNFVFVGGHSQGAGRAGLLSSKFKLPCILFGCGPPPLRPNVFGLNVLGEFDGDGSRVVRRHPNDVKNDITVVKLSDHSTEIVPHNTDHSLRVRRRDDLDKEAACLTRATLDMTYQIALHVQQFVERVLKAA